MMVKIKVFLLKWIFKTNDPPSHRIGYNGFLIYLADKDIRKFMETYDLFPKGDSLKKYMSN